MRPRKRGRKNKRVARPWENAMACLFYDFGGMLLVRSELSYSSTKLVEIETAGSLGRQRSRLCALSAPDQPVRCQGAGVGGSPSLHGLGSAPNPAVPPATFTGPLVTAKRELSARTQSECFELTVRASSDPARPTVPPPALEIGHRVKWQAPHSPRPITMQS